MNKDTSMMEFLQTCPILKENPLFFNFGSVEDNANQVIPNSDDVSLDTTFVDGSEAKRYTFNIDSFKSVAYNSIVEGMADENLDDFNDVQAIANWVNEQGKQEIFPNFGENCLVETMKTLTNKPKLVSVNSNTNPPIAVYRISIQIDYIDYTNQVWNK